MEEFLATVKDPSLLGVFQSSFTSPTLGCNSHTANLGDLFRVVDVYGYLSSVVRPITEAYRIASRGHPPVHPKLMKSDEFRLVQPINYKSRETQVLLFSQSGDAQGRRKDSYRALFSFFDREPLTCCSLKSMGFATLLLNPVFIRYLLSMAATAANAHPALHHF